MAKDGKHIIHAGGVFPNPLLNREGAAAASTQPGTIGFFSSADKFTASVAGNEAAILYVATKITCAACQLMTLSLRVSWWWVFNRCLACS